MRALDRMKDALAADDLFRRVSCFFYAAVAAAIGGFIACLLIASPARDTMPLALYALFWLIAAAFLAWATVLLIGCVSPADTRPTRWAANARPSIVDFDGESSLFKFVTFLPAAVLTLLLRGIGLRGRKSKQSADLIEEVERNGRSPWSDLTP